MQKKKRKDFFSSRAYLAILFLISGFAALIYQIVWQRALFTAYGVNIESITVIVSLFMFGLGLGALAGGILVKKFPERAAQFFLACEIGIGLFGVFSLPLIALVTRLTVNCSLPVISLKHFIGTDSVFRYGAGIRNNRLQNS